MTYACVPTGKPQAFSHSPRRISVGTVAVLSPAVTVEATTAWNGSGIGERFAVFVRGCGVREALRDVVAMGGLRCEVTREAVGDGPRRLMGWTPPLSLGGVYNACKSHPRLQELPP